MFVSFKTEVHKSNVLLILDITNIYNKKNILSLNKIITTKQYSFLY